MLQFSPGVGGVTVVKPFKVVVMQLGNAVSTLAPGYSKLKSSELPLTGTTTAQAIVAARAAEEAIMSRYFISEPLYPNCKFTRAAVTATSTACRK